MASLLPLPDDPGFRNFIAAWDAGYQAHFAYPRSAWLSHFEELLREAYPNSSSRDRKLTARHYAPFPLAAGHDVP